MYERNQNQLGVSSEDLAEERRLEKSFCIKASLQFPRENVRESRSLYKQVTICDIFQDVLPLLIGYDASKVIGQRSNNS